MYIVSHPPQCLDGCGPYHNTTSVADLAGDEDLDVVLNNLRHETDTIVWAGATLWINQGGGKFTPRRVDLGGPSTVAGDLDGDGFGLDHAGLGKLGRAKGIQHHRSQRQQPAQANANLFE